MWPIFDSVLAFVRIEADIFWPYVYNSWLNSDLEYCNYAVLRP